jgi:hypothetical protein
VIKKSLMVLKPFAKEQLSELPETGMNFYIVKSPNGFLFIDSDGKAIPLYFDDKFYCLKDLELGTPLPRLSHIFQDLNLLKSFPSIKEAVAELRIQSARYISFSAKKWAIPLVSTDSLSKPMRFYRFLSSNSDCCFNGTELLKNTYLTSVTDGSHVTSGFEAVGRYSLPIPFSANYRAEYLLPAATAIDVGTVAPNFGQSGGGVEVRLHNDTKVTFIGLHALPVY